MSDKYRLEREHNVWEILGGMFMVFIVMALIGDCINETESAPVAAPASHASQ